MSLFRSTSGRRYAVLAVCAFALTVLPGTSVWATARSIAARTFAGVSRAVAPAFGRSAAAALPPGPAIAATMTATLPAGGYDFDADGKADPGDVVQYSTKITNSGTDATGVHFSSVPPSGTTLFGTPLVIADDSYSSVGNMTLDTSTLGSCGGNAAYSVMCNDTSGTFVSGFGNSQGTAGGTVADGVNTVTTTNSGTVKLNGTSGAFVYNPAAAFSGTDTFYYTLSNGTISGVAKVSIAVGGSNGMVWFASVG